MGGDKSYVFMKAPLDFLRQITACVEFFTYKAHSRLMKKLDNPVLLVDLFKECSDSLQEQKENVDQYVEDLEQCYKEIS